MKPVRFSTLVEKCGKPAVFLPLGDPKRDRSFMQAVREERILTIKQERFGGAGSISSGSTSTAR